MRFLRFSAVVVIAENVSQDILSFSQQHTIIFPPIFFLSYILQRRRLFFGLASLHLHTAEKSKNRILSHFSLLILFSFPPLFRLSRRNRRCCTSDPKSPPEVAKNSFSTQPLKKQKVLNASSSNSESDDVDIHFELLTVLRYA